jgi:hypothetical protein
MRNGQKITSPIAPYQTDDLYLAAFLLCHGLDLLGTHVDQVGRVRFLFSDSANNKLHSATASFLADGEVRARQFMLTVLKLKKNISRPIGREEIRRFNIPANTT